MSKKLSCLPCGAKIKFGAYSVNGEGSHKIKWIKVNKNDTTFISEYIEDFRAFDAKEPNNPDNYCSSYGNNRYSVSNIDLFLNSSDEKWFITRHDFDSAPTNDNVTWATGYDGHCGFLSHFTDWELNVILDTEVTTATPNDDSEAENETIIRKVFLPSVMNVFGRMVRNTREGVYWDYFNDGASRKAYATHQAINETKMEGGTPSDEQDPWYWSLRSPYAFSPDGVLCVVRNGSRGRCRACNGSLGCAQL